jgi:hypothetical protein
VRSDERRETPRIRKGLIVKYRLASAGAGQWRMSPLKDLSATGVRFIAEGGFPLGSALELQLCLPSRAQPLSVAGIVRWAGAVGAGALTEHGVSFSQPDAAAQQQIAQAVEFFLNKERERG